MRSSVVDPAIITFIEQVNAGTNAAADSTAGLLLRLLGRIGKLEKTVETQGAMLEKVRKQPAMRAKTHDSAPAYITKTGVDCYGVPEVIEQRVRRPKGRPRGARDGQPRARRKPAVAFKDIETQLIGPLAAGLLDEDFDDR
jgi:hypothetical protein